MTEEQNKPAARRLIALILDKSGSMEGYKKEAIAGFKTQADTIRDMAKDGIETLVTLVQFSSDVEEVCFNVPVDQMSISKKYEPDGMTSLFDAVGQTLEKLEKEAKPDDSVLVVVISDGQENSSTNYDGKKLATLVAKLQNTGRWTISFMISKESLDDIVKLGVARSSVSTYATRDPLLHAAAYGMVSAATKTWMGGASLGKPTQDFYKSDIPDDIDKNAPEVQAVVKNIDKNDGDMLSWKATQKFK